MMRLKFLDKSYRLKLQISLIISVFTFSNCLSADMTKIESLSFGRIAIKDNSQSWQLRQLSNGTTIVQEGIIVLESGQPGEYLFYNLPASTEIDVSIIDGTGSMSFAGGNTAAQFSIEPYLDFPTYTTDVHGEFTLIMPGVLTTSGDATSYSDGIYYRFFQLELTY